MSLDLDNPTGEMSFGGNELLVDSKVDDPSALRLGAPITQRGLGKIGFDVLLPNGTRNEVVLIQGKQTGEGVPDGRRGGEFYLGVAKPNMGTTDDAMHDALVVTYDEGFRFNLPIYAPNLTSSGGDGANEYATGISTRNRRYRLQANDDGVLVYMDYGVTPPRALKVLAGPLG